MASRRSLANAKDVTEVLSRFEKLGPRAERRWGVMSVGEMLCHVADANDCALARWPAAAADSVFRRTVLKSFALWAPMPWPHGVKTRPEFDPRLEGTRPEEFERDRRRVVHSIREIAALESPVEGARHPASGPMTLPEWKRWGYLHADHHLRQFSA